MFRLFNVAISFPHITTDWGSKSMEAVKQRTLLYHCYKLHVQKQFISLQAKMDFLRQIGHDGHFFVVFQVFSVKFVTSNEVG